MKKLICEDWVLYETEYFNQTKRESYTGKHFVDVGTKNKSLRVFGTSEQLLEYSKLFKIDESYTYKVEEKGSYWYNTLTDIINYNKVVSKNLSKYEEMYIKNNNKIVVLI